MNEHDPAGQASGRGVSSPPPWPSFGARPPGGTQEADLPASSDGEYLLGAHTGQRDSADDGPAPAKPAVAEDDPDAEYDTGAQYDADAEYDDQDDIVIIAASTSFPDTPADGSLTGSVIPPASAAVRPADSGRSHTNAMIIPPGGDVDAATSESGRADAVIIPASATSGAPGGDRPNADASMSPTSMSPASTSPAGTASAGAADGTHPRARHQVPAYGHPDPRREQWRSIQSAFVDDPRSSVAAAADLAAKEIGLLVARAQKRERELRGEWDRDDTDTERLRNALRHYRDFLERLPAL